MAAQVINTLKPKGHRIMSEEVREADGEGNNEQGRRREGERGTIGREGRKEQVFVYVLLLSTHEIHVREGEKTFVCVFVCLYKCVLLGSSA